MPYKTITMREAMRKYLPMHYNGKTYMSISEPFCDHSRSLYPFYEGDVICIDERREDGLYTVYSAAWNALEEFVEETNNDPYNPEYLMVCEDESAACDWDKPFDIAPTGCEYNPQTGEIFE